MKTKNQSRRPGACLHLACFLLASVSSAQAQSFRYFYDDSRELFRVLDSSGTLIEYVHDLSGNIIGINRSTVPPAALSILNVVPLNGAAGQTVTIYGQNFSASAAGNLVQFGGATATVVSASSTALIVQVPPAFTSGLITVTVNGVTVDSGSLAFTPPPFISSITPSFGAVGQTLTGVVIQGANLSGVVFSLPGGGVVTPVTSGSSQATVNIALGQAQGPYVLIAAAANSVTSVAQSTPANTMYVYNTPGNNYSDLAFSILNTNGPTPNYPPGTSETDLAFSVLNATGPMPNYPPGTSETDLAFSVLNTLGPAPNYPAGTNEAWQLFSTQNQSGGTSPAPMAIGVSLAGRPEDALPGGRSPLRLIAGQTVVLTLRPSLFLQYLEVDADRAPLASSTSGALSVPFTAPFGVDSFGLSAFGYTSYGPASGSLTETVRVVADPGRTISGLVTDASGSPLPGAAVAWQAQGLAAEYYRFDRELTKVPDLAGVPARVSFLGAANYPNPQQVFGQDPMGAGLGGNYAVRLSGKIRLDSAGLYQFVVRAHRGARLKIDGVLVAESAATGPDAQLAAGAANLTAGDHDIEVTHFESGGAAALQLLWTPPGGVEAVIPPAAITADAPASMGVVTGSDGRFELRVPAALDGVAVKLAAGTGAIHVDR